VEPGAAAASREDPVSDHERQTGHPAKASAANRTLKNRGRTAGPPRPNARRSQQARTTGATALGAPDGHAQAQDPRGLRTLSPGHPRGTGHSNHPEVITGERDAGKLARPVREGIVGKGPQPEAPRRGSTSLDGRGLETEPSQATAPVPDPTQSPSTSPDLMAFPFSRRIRLQRYFRMSNNANMATHTSIDSIATNGRCPDSAQPPAIPDNTEDAFAIHLISWRESLSLPADQRSSKLPRRIIRIMQTERIIQFHI
jgi:hypothetical protein